MIRQIIKFIRFNYIIIFQKNGGEEREDLIEYPSLSTKRYHIFGQCTANYCGTLRKLSWGFHAIEFIKSKSFYPRIRPQWGITHSSPTPPLKSWNKLLILIQRLMMIFLWMFWRGSDCGVHDPPRRQVLSQEMGLGSPPLSYIS